MEKRDQVSIKKDNPEEPGSENLLGLKVKYKSTASKYSEIMNSEPRKKKKFIVPEFEDSLFQIPCL